MNHRVPAQSCLAGKSGLASLIIVRALALPVPRVSPTPASRGVFFAAVCLAHVCLLTAAGSLASHCQAKHTQQGRSRPWGLHIPPWGSAHGKGAGNAALGAHPAVWRPPAWGGRPALIPSGCLHGCLGHIWSASSSLAQAQLLPKGEEGPRDQARQMLGVALRWGWVVCLGDGAETRQVPEYCCSRC